MAIKGRNATPRKASDTRPVKTNPRGFAFPRAFNRHKTQVTTPSGATQPNTADRAMTAVRNAGQSGMSAARALAKDARLAVGRRVGETNIVRARIGVQRRLNLAKINVGRVQRQLTAGRQKTQAQIAAAKRNLKIAWAARKTRSSSTMV
jgi:hypothetical protein